MLLSRSLAVYGKPARSSSSSSSVQVQAMQDSSRQYPKGIEDTGVKLPKAPDLVLTDAERTRLDERPDGLFYATPRMMQHAEAEDLARLSGLYKNIIPAGARVLELCASRHSHLPADMRLELVGQGMNEQELSANQDLTQWFIQDLNVQSLLLEQSDSSYDGVLCVNGIQYLTQPEVVVAEAHRLTRPGGFMLIAFGEHYFSEKAIAGWITRSPSQRSDLVARIMKGSGYEPLLVEHPAGHSAECSTRLCVVIGIKPAITGRSRSTSASMRADNVQEWFTKPGLAGLVGSTAKGSDHGQPSLEQQLYSVSTQTSTQSVRERWHGAYEVLVSDAVDMGIPRSVIPVLDQQATPEEIQNAVQHLQDMVASFLSSGL